MGNTNRKRWLSAAAIVALVSLGAYVAYYQFIAGQPLPDGLIQANGRIEGDHITVASKFAGRIAELKVTEGDLIQAGQVLAVIDDAQIRARVAQTTAAIDVIDAQIAATETAIAVQRKELPLAIDSAAANVSRADAAVDVAKAEEFKARQASQRARALLTRGFVSAERAEQAETILSVATAQLKAARQAALQAQQQYSLQALGADRIRAKEGELEVLRAQREQALANLEETQSILADLSIRAPSAGIVVARIRQAGEVVSSGSPLFDLVDLDKLYLKVFVPEVQIGKLRRGLPARVFVDAYPGTPFPAAVRYISSRAEFTPKEVQTPDERVKLTYAVKLYLDKNPDHKLTPGLPADAVIRWNEDALWAKPRW